MTRRLNMQKHFTEVQFIGFLREEEAGIPVAELSHKRASSKVSYYLWRSKFSDMNALESKRLKEL